MFMNLKSLMLAVFVILTVAFALLAAVEYVTPRVLTTTIAAETSATLTSCSYTTMPAEIECPHFFNQTYTISVDYAGPWGASYQGYLSTNGSNLVESGSFYGYVSGNQSVTVNGWTSSDGITICAEAQKLDPSNSTLVLMILPPVNVTNQTSSAYGSTKTCLSDEIV